MIRTTNEGGFAISRSKRAVYQANWQAIWRHVLALFAATFFTTGAHSAVLLKGTPNICDWRLEGEIQRGDQMRVSETVSEQSSLCLNSPGGDYMEGLALFLHFAQARIATVVQAQHACSSACAIAFMGGADGKYGDRFPKRTLITGARLGFHSPYLADRTTPPQPLAQGVALGISYVAALLRADKYKLMPADLIADMLETGPNDLFYIETLAKAKKLKITVDGMPAPKAITTVMLYQACVNSDPWMEDQQEAVDPKDIKRRAVSDKPGLYRVEFGPGGFGFRASESCAVSVITRPGAPQQLVVDLDYVPEQQSLLQRPPQLPNEKPLWYLLPSSSRIFR
jgi:hypothetical protein